MSVRRDSRRAIVMLALLVLLPACDGGTEPGEDRLLSVKQGDENRTFIVYIPARYDGEKAVPLLIAFHGTPGNGPGMRLSTGLDEIADSEGWLIAYPNGTGGSWAAGCLCLDPDFSGVDDIGFVNQMLGRIRSEYEVDMERIYSVGFSAGGVMSYRVACDLAETFAAVASVASSMSWAQAESCEPSKPVSVFSMIGSDDQAFPWRGSGPTAGHSMPIDSTFAFWGRANACEPDPTTDYAPQKDNGLDVRRERFQNCSSGSEVTQYIIEDGTHLWPKTANGTLLGFFERH